MINPSIYDSILRHKKNNQYIVANTFLHILDQHPDFIDKYDLSVRIRISQSILNALYILFRFFQAIFYKHRSIFPKKNKLDVLFVSHLTNKEQFKQDYDPYFGDIPKKLHLNGFNSNIILINHIKANNRHTSKVWNDSKVPRIILNPCLNFLSELNLYLSQMKEKKTLKFILDDLNINKKDKNDILLNHLSPSTFNALRIAKQLADIVISTNVNYIITTYEGHAWERLVYYYVRKANPNIKCIGYQHGPVFKYQHAIKRPLGSFYDPNFILTSGKISQKILTNCKSLKNISIKCIGSPKNNNPKKIKDKVNCCLVIPQGTIKECMCLFNLTWNYAKKNKEQRFIWRLHPLMSFNKLKKQSFIFENLPSNINLSKSDLAIDISKCDSVLYRGSSAVIDAINCGLKPIYYQKSIDEPSIDPIYQLTLTKDIIYNQNDLKLALKKNIDLNNKKGLQNYAQNFYSPFDFLALKEVLR